jgi:hypothetical protein
MPLCKGVFMKITLNLNNTVVVFNATLTTRIMSQTQGSCQFPLGGINPIMIASAVASSGMAALQVGATPATDYTVSLSVGGVALDAASKTAGSTAGPLLNMTLTVPSYTFNPIYEQAYLSNPVRKIDYEDIYQYQVLNTVAGGTFNNLITNGIAGIKSVLVIPFHTAVSAVNNTISPLQSSFDSAGGGTTSPLTFLNNFNVVISGQNAIYNSQRYTYEEFLNQLNGQNGVNGSQIDGMSSGLISQYDFESSYNYYYVNVERCLPMEKGVSKSVNIIGQNTSLFAIDLYVFISYGCSVNLNLFTGQRV